MLRSIRPGVTTLVLATAVLAACVQTAETKDIGYDANADAFALRDAALAQAASEQKLVLLISGGDWCKWCHYLAAFLEHETALDAALHDVFVVAKVYVGEENMNKEFFATLPKAAGAPHFWVLSAKGELLASQDTLPLEDGAKSYDPAKFYAFIDKWQHHDTASTH
jgi:thioredoxin-related protein